MLSLGRRRRPTRSVVAVLVAISCALGLASCSAAPAKPIVLNVGSTTFGRSIQPGFVGLSMEYPTILGYAGDDPSAPNPVFEQLVRNLAPGQRPVLRIGGNSSDWSWWPVPGMPRPQGIRFTLTNSWVAVGRALATALDGRLILGINLEADSGRIAATMAHSLVDGIGRGDIAGLELGNEPELYSGFPWYTTPGGRRVRGRARDWDFNRYLSDYSKIVRSVAHVPLAGPSIGSPSWMTHVPRFLSAQPHTALVTVHRYPLKHCSASHHIAAAELLSDASSRGLADSVARYVASAHARGIPLRIDEMNSISCGGERGLSETFATSLWAVDALFEMARVGVDGVNIHTSPQSINELFRFRSTGGKWSGEVHPVYYGLMMFAQAAPPGSQLIRVGGTPRDSAVKTWATRATDGTIRVTMINRGASKRTIKLRAREPNHGANVTPTLERLRAPSIHAQSGVTLGGQSFGRRTNSGLLAGKADTPTVTPDNGVYTVELPATSAALLTIPR